MTEFEVLVERVSLIERVTVELREACGELLREYDELAQEEDESVKPLDALVVSDDDAETEGHDVMHEESVPVEKKLELCVEVDE